jgi:predicted transcriptional regulator
MNAGARDRAGRAARGAAGRAVSPRRGPGELSAMVLDVLRQADRALTAGEVRSRLADAGVGPLAYSTVVTILSRLHAQAAADRIRVGRAYAYQEVTDPAERAALRMRRVLDAEDDRAGVLARFVGDLDARDELVVRELLGADLAPGRGAPGGSDQAAK